MYAYIVSLAMFPGSCAHVTKHEQVYRGITIHALHWGCAMYGIK